MAEKEANFWVSLFSGGVAGTTVDVALYPLDTIKTRLQSPQGFLRAGGFSGVYNGLNIAAAGSAPGAALFFSTYEMSKKYLKSYSNILSDPVVHMTAASLGEVAACTIRVPTENVKQKMQAGLHSSTTETIGSIYRTGGLGGFYNGFGITIMREIPFAVVQFPIYEAMKVAVARALGRPTRSYEAALCGSISGGIAAAVTTPLDVIKTRLMLGTDSKGVPYKGAIDIIGKLVEEAKSPEGAAHGNGGAGRGIGRVFFAGVQPRVMWISIGGFFFFGAYEQASRFFELIL